MAKKTTIKELKAVYQKKLDFIDNSLSDFDADLKRLQAELFDLLITDYVSQFTVTDGVIVMSERNLRLLASLNKVMQQFKETFTIDTFKTLGENMLKMSDLTSNYFKVMTGGKKIIDTISAKLEKYRAAVGLDKKGEIIKGSFLDKLSSTPEMNSKLSRYMQDAVTKEMDYTTFSQGLKDMVKGSSEVDGAMEKYVGTYAHDTFFSQARQQDNFFADELGLDCFLYAGEIIETSRPFCRERHGKYFTREQGDSWNSLEWKGKIPGVDFFDQVGGFLCRHTIMWTQCDEAGITIDENFVDENSE